MKEYILFSQIHVVCEHTYTENGLCNQITKIKYL